MTRTSTAPAADIYQSVTDRIIAALLTHPVNPPCQPTH